MRALVLLLGLLTVQPAVAVTVPTPAGNLLNVPVESLFERKFKQVVRQNYDVSCGAAALATVFRYSYNDKVEEREVIEGILAETDPANVRGAGFSMLELKRYSEQRGYVVQGFKVTDVVKLGDVEIPMVTLINSRGYNHFVVIKDVRDGAVYIADPAFGNRALTLSDFTEEWRNVVLLIVHPERVADKQFVLDGITRAPTQDIKLLLDHKLVTIRPVFGEF